MGLSNWIQEGILLWQDVDLKLQAAVAYVLTILLRGKVDPEGAWILLFELESLPFALWLQILVIVVLSEAHATLGKLSIVKEWLQVDRCLTNQII